MNSLPTSITEPTEFVHKGFTLRALSHQKARTLKIFDKHYGLLRPEMSDGHLSFCWTHIAKNLPEIWELLLALGTLSHDKTNRYEIILSNGESINPKVFDRTAFFTEHHQARLFGSTFTPFGCRYVIEKR